MDDPRWSTPVSIPGEAFSKAARLAGSGSPIHHLVNIAVYGSERNGTRRIKPADALSAFEAALTLVLANGQIAAEAMFQAGFPRAEIDDRISRYTRALHFVSTSDLMPSCLDASPVVPHASVPSAPNPSAFFAAPSEGRAISAASGHNPDAAFSVTRPESVTTPTRAISSSAADEGAPPSAVSPSACAPTASSGGEA